MSALKATKNKLISQLFWQMEIGADDAISVKPSLQEKMINLKEYFGTFDKNQEAGSDPKKSNTDFSNFEKTIGRFESSTAKLKETSSNLNERNKLDSINTLKELRTAMELFAGCGLKNTANHFVFSDGNPDAKIMIIGEAPGKEEDKIGVPFVGQAGQLLDKMLNSVGLDRNCTYITNYIPWRPPGNRTPSQEEIDILKPFVIRHIQLKKPAIILALGGVAAKSLLEVETGILKLRGKIQHKNFGLNHTIPVLPTLHPAYLLRAPAQKKFAFSDLVTLKRAFLSF